MVPCGVKHGYLVDVPQGANAVVRCCGANEDTHVAPSNGLLGIARIFQGFIRALQELPLLRV
jgi:hypothetical protein